MHQSRELPEDRLATADEKGRRIWLYPADVRGFFRRARSRIQAVLIVFFLALPWVHVRGHQAVLLDIPRRQFTIFGVQFWAHDAPMLLFVFGGAALSLAFVTAIWGRVWCGWACPQTVFIDGVFRRIERWVEGDGFTRKRRDEGPFTAGKLGRKTAKWTLYLLVSIVITHSFLAYFVGTDVLMKMMEHSPFENPTAALIAFAATAAVLFDFGWFREQFCIILCPYGRLQSVLMDDHTMVVAYDAARGEPRKAGGDCVNCYRCVQVCPTGVDIRRGVQLECIACTSCIDACDEVMTRLHKAKGLIRYDTVQGLRGEKARKLKINTAIYGAVLAFFAIGLIVSVHFKTPFSAVFVRAIGDPYQVVAGPSGAPVVVNRFKLDVGNQSFQEMDVALALDPSWRGRGVELIAPVFPLKLAPGESRRVDVFVKFPDSLLISGHATIATSFDTVERPYRMEVHLVGPFH